MGDKKNIIILSALWSGVRSFFIDGDQNFKGMPAFTNTFFRLIENEEIGIIHIIFFGKNIETFYKLQEKYDDKLKVYGYSYTNLFSAFYSMIRVCKKILILNSKEKIHLIYSHGPISGLAAIISNLTSIPNVRRIYGTFLARKVKKSKLNIFISHPLEYLSFALPGKALIITNDGTKGDVVYNKIGSKKLPLYFWLNGIDKSNNNIVDLNNFSKKYDFNFKPDLCYIARIDEWKRQHLLIDILIESKKNGNIYNTIIAGPVINNAYFKKLQDKLKKAGLDSNIIIIPGLTKEESLSVIKNSTLSVSLYDFSNLGNVFLESLSLGTVMLTQNIEGSLNLIPESVYFNLNPQNVKESSKKVDSIFSNNELIVSKSLKAIEFSHSSLLSWEERAHKEIDLLGIN